MANSASPGRYSRRALLRLLGLAAGSAVAARPAAAITERIYTDVYSGLALFGHDPVAYFVDGRARMGERENEVAWGGTYWHFVNKGNAGAFVDAPEIYCPLYGGYDVIGVARGVPQPTDPRVFLIHADRLLLFNSVRTRDEFLADPAGYRAIADQRWPKIRETLAP